jgi:hypothetical protein
MNAQVRMPEVHLNPADAVIEQAEVCAGHDGTAELVVSIRYENGAEGKIVLDADTVFDVLSAVGANDLSALTGRAWRDILKRL